MAHFRVLDEGMEGDAMRASCPPHRVEMAGRRRDKGDIPHRVEMG